MSGEPFNYSGKLAYLIASCRDPRLLRSDTAVLSVLVDHANQKTGKAWPSMATISKESRVPRATVVRAIKRLESAGCFTVDRSDGAVSNYTLTRLTSDTGLTADTGINQSANWSHGWNRTRPTSDADPVSRVRPEQKKDLTGRTDSSASKEADAEASLASTLWREGLQTLSRLSGQKPARLRSVLGKWRKSHDDARVLSLIVQAEKQAVSEPVAWITKALSGQGQSPEERAAEREREHQRAEMEYYTRGAV